ncbi:NYN domain-containing protein, partial [Blautia hydrogenotrophica]|uniref:NYN domain-containing protein n=1 Tax=Blautia hydrogenotrophica TaxID=53443 RepID=UPI00258F0257
YGSAKRPKEVLSSRVTRTYSERPIRRHRMVPEKEYLLVDGYNIIFAWEDLKELAEVNIDGARTKLMDILCNYQGYKKCVLILVFDAYKVEGHECEVTDYHNIHVVYTKEAETADQYIEKVVHEIGRKYQVTVATSDGLEQVIIRGQGASLLSARELREEISLVNEQIRQECDQRRQRGKNYLFDHLSEELVDYMEEVRLGKKEIE